MPHVPELPLVALVARRAEADELVLGDQFSEADKSALDADVLDELAALAKDAGPHEKIKRGKGVIYWQVPNKGTLDTTIGKTMGKKRYKSSTTTRNLRTLDKVLR